MRLVLIKGYSEDEDDEAPSGDILKHQDTLKKLGTAASTDPARMSTEMNLGNILVSDKYVAATDGMRVHVWHHGGNLTRQGVYDPNSLVRKKSEVNTNHLDRVFGNFGKLEYTPSEVSKETFKVIKPWTKKQRTAQYAKAKKVGNYLVNAGFVKDAISFVGKNHEIHVDQNNTEASPIRISSNSEHGRREAFVLPYRNDTAIAGQVEEKKKSNRPTMTFDGNGQLQTFEHEKLGFDKSKTDKEHGLRIDPSIREDKYKKIYSSKTEEFHVSKTGMEGRGASIYHDDKANGRTTIYKIEKEPYKMEKVVTPRKFMVSSWHRGSKTFPEVSYDENNSLFSIRHDDFEFGKGSGMHKIPTKPTTLHDSPTDRFHVVPHEDGSGATLAHYDKVAGNIRVHSIEKIPDKEGDKWSVTSETFKP